MKCVWIIIFIHMLQKIKIKSVVPLTKPLSDNTSGVGHDLESKIIDQ